MDHNGDDSRLSREEYGSTIWWQSQDDTWGQEDKEQGWNNQVCGSECEFETKMDDGPRQKSQDQSMKHHLYQKSRTWWEAKQKPWTQESKEYSWHEDFWSRDVDHLYKLTKFESAGLNL
jgi:hypothetical protein